LDIGKDGQENGQVANTEDSFEANHLQRVDGVSLEQSAFEGIEKPVEDKGNEHYNVPDQFFSLN
jgi:hypothetical protein